MTCTSTCPGSVANCQCEGAEGTLTWIVGPLDDPVFRIAYSDTVRDPTPQISANGYTAVLSAVDMSNIFSSTLSVTVNLEQVSVVCRSNTVSRSTTLQAASK